MWISSKEFAIENNINKKSLEKACFRASLGNKKFCSYKHNILCFKYISGKGHAGKTLQIWSKPLSKEEASLIDQGFSIEDISHDLSNCKNASTQAYLAKHTYKDEFSNKTTQEFLSKPLNDDVLLKNSNTLKIQNASKALEQSSNNIESNKMLSTREFNTQDERTQDKHLLMNHTNFLSEFAKASSKKQNLALQKAAVVKEWLHAKGKISTNDFISYINAKKIYEFKLTQNKLFAWQKEYLARGLDALVDKRENKKADEIERLGIKELFVNTLLAQK
ncbi:hypothetical protein CQA75_02485, partial [Campylobacter taeniopygiae]